LRLARRALAVSKRSIEAIRRSKMLTDEMIPADALLDMIDPVVRGNDRDQ